MRRQRHRACYRVRGSQTRRRAGSRPGRALGGSFRSGRWFCRAETLRNTATGVSDGLPSRAARAMFLLQLLPGNVRAPRDGLDTDGSRSVQTAPLDLTGRPISESPHEPHRRHRQPRRNRGPRKAPAQGANEAQRQRLCNVAEARQAEAARRVKAACRGRHRLGVSEGPARRWGRPFVRQGAAVD